MYRNEVEVSILNSWNFVIRERRQCNPKSEDKIPIAKKPKPLPVFQRRHDEQDKLTAEVNEKDNEKDLVVRPMFSMIHVGELNQSEQGKVF